MEEEEGSLTVDVMRLGSMKGTVKVKYHTDTWPCLPFGFEKLCNAMLVLESLWCVCFLFVCFGGCLGKTVQYLSWNDLPKTK